MTPILLGFGGKPGHGKSAAAQAIALRYRSFVWSISELIAEELGMRREDVADVSVLQKHSHTRCAEDPLYWARRIQRLALEESPGAQVVLCANVRRREEAEFFRGQGWTLARVIALNADGSLHTPMAAARDLNDPLETELDHWNWDYRLISRKPGGIAWLETQAVALAGHLLGGGA